MTPHFFGCTESGLLVLENLQESEFHAKQRGSLLNLSECRVVLESIARFHVLSMGLTSMFQTDLGSIETSISSNNGDWLTEIYIPLVANLRKHVLPSCSESVRKKFEEYMRRVGSIRKLGYSPNNEGFNVILHGDLHLHNILFKNDLESNVTQCKLVDFQICHLGSPIIDILYFLITGVEFKVFKKNRLSLLNCYIQELEITLKKFGSCKLTPRPFGLNESLNDFEKYKLFFLYRFTILVPLFWAGQMDSGTLNKESNIDTVLKSAEFLSLFNGWAEYLLQ